MKHVVRCMVLLVVVGLAAAPAWAAEMRVTGFIDNVFPRWDSNNSNADLDATRNDDQVFFGRTRGRVFFNFIASDDLRGVFAIEVDQTYGAPANDRLGSGCIEGEGTFASYDCGFDNGIDNNVLELKQLYVDFRIPQIPIGNRWRLGGLPFTVTPLHSQVLYTMDAGGGDVRFTFSDQVSLLMYYVQLEEDLDRFQGSNKIGEDYLTGGTLLSNTVDPQTLPAWLGEADLDYYVGEFSRTGFRGGLNWYRNLRRNWELSAPWRGQPIRQPSQFIAGSRDGVT